GSHKARPPGFHAEPAEAGYKWAELGPCGYLPTDPSQLADEVGSRGLQVSGGTTFGALHRPHEWDQMVASTSKVAELAAAAGAHHLVFIPVMYRDEKTGAFTESPELTAEQWASFGARA